MILKNVDATVKRETLYIAAAVGVMSLLLQSVFLIAQRWDYTVLLGNLLSAAAVIVNFFFMGLTVQRSLDKDEKDAVTAVKFSQQIRLLMMFVVVALGAALPCFNLYAVIIPLFFPRIAVALRPKFRGQTGG
ncbi:MAG: ATP synthase subunit I [Clostridia bacterium]|nr:ATP synthase subunit I [Clostridia bacterium]MBQ1554857.1 ATP synthase subunit I [Clostridia bacterium]